jgi:hypothetical protein
MTDRSPSDSRRAPYFGDRIELPEDAVLVHQERAYTSPIWYTP